MSHAALYLNPEAFDTRGPRLMGRQAAGESFLRGYLRHTTADHLHFWNVANRPQAELESFVRSIAPVDRPATWIARQDRNGLGRAGNVHYPTPNVAREAWHRNSMGGALRYGISGITHTTAGQDVMDSLADLMTAPVEPWDSLICTSSAVRTSVDEQLQAVRASLRERVGATRFPEPLLTTIPLGINTADFSVSAAGRATWRAKLSIPDDAVVVLYVGRFTAKAKMNPIPMAMALERAAQAADRPVVWVLAGWGGSEAASRTFHDETRAFCPSVTYKVVDGRQADVRFSIWSVADIFLSLSDNIQETFGLTPVEAMAAGVPCVISDWNGYRDTVRHGIDGFRAATAAPAPGTGNDLAYRHANHWTDYDGYVGAASQLIAVDVGEAAQALGDLIADPDLRRRMGQAAQERARATFDWAAVVPQYEALWAEMTARREAAVAHADRPVSSSANPRRLDPFRLFGNYAGRWLTGSSCVMLTPGKDWDAARAVLRAQNATFGGFALPTVEELHGLVERLSAAPGITAEALTADVPPSRRPYVQRGILWLVKYDIVTLLPDGGDARD